APGVWIQPVVHEHVESTPYLRQVLEELDPATVAVELPVTLEKIALRAVARLPKISLIVSEHPGEDALVWAVTPADPLCEAIRWGIERDRKIAFIDPDLPYSEKHVDPIPDPHALAALGPETYFGRLLEHYRKRPQGRESDLQREAGMAFYLDRLRQHQENHPIVACIGAAHVDGVRKRLGSRLGHPFSRSSRASLELRHVSPASLTGILVDPPLAHAVWEKARTGAEPPRVEAHEAMAKKTSVLRFGLRVIQGEKGESAIRRRNRVVDYAWSCCHRPQDLVYRLPARPWLERAVWTIATGSYREQTDENLADWQRGIFFRFSHRYARVKGLLAGGLYEWVIAARGVADDNLAWEVFDTARTYPWQEEIAEIPSVAIDGSDLDLGTRKVRFRRRFFRVKHRPVLVPVRERPVPDTPEAWLEAFDSTGLCSYPPEDLVIEDYGAYLQRKAISLMSAERSRVEPFTTSLLDGIDIRETLQKLHEGRVYVEEKGRVPGEAGSVVIIFEPDPLASEYPFSMTWLGEHDQESDMAFYATDPADQIVGPGIMRATYGGLMLTQPRGRLFDVWSDPDYRFAVDRADVLTMAAIDYSQEKIIVHVGPKPPGSRLRDYARAHTKLLKHIPLATLSPVSIKRIRVLHILAGRDKRALAPDYVW
ncbi:MAG: hypothetical protein P8Y44_10545, partial [Acidobacteriota bacterium]